jgi:thiaminase
LPLTDRDVALHALPNHRNGHNTYSDKQLDEHVDKIYDMVDQAWNDAKDKKCDPEALKDIYDKLIAVEDDYWELLISRPGASMA